MRTAVFLLVAVVHQGVTLRAQDERIDVVDVREEQNAPGTEQKSISPLRINTGFIFANGDYIPPPYRITFSDNDVSINDVSLALSFFDTWKNEKRIASGASQSHAQQVRRRLRLLLENRGSLVLFAGQPPSEFGRVDSCDLLRVLIDTKSRQDFFSGNHHRLSSFATDPVWATWIAEFQCPEELAQRAGELTGQIEQVTEENFSRISALRLFEKCVYPMTIIGMVLVVAAFGHLLSSRPSPHNDVPGKPGAGRAVFVSLALIIALSLLDLTWTLLVSRTSLMKEVNPLGAALIDNPQALIALKTAATLFAVTLLYVLRQHRAAQQGAWWGCLVCTLLTARWLTFTSMLA